MDFVSPTSEPRIIRLSDILINQIAAGEVVERPASVIKELIENSLDAVSTRIEIILQGGGIEEIQIVDNGCGMMPADLKLCIERHTTSKIKNAVDLEAIGSYGFRGEALSSIASVATLTIKSRTPESEKAYAITVEFGEITGDLRPVGAAVGTTVQIRDLFSRVPARQKFLRSPSTEFSHCARVVRELALGSPGVDFSLVHQGKRVAQYMGPTREIRFRECYDVDWTPLHLHEQSGDATLEAFLSPSHLVQDRGELSLYINGRVVRNRSLLAAVRNGYLSTLGAHHEPSGVLYLDIRKDWVDVNVHPQKLEVRCLRQETLYPWILSSVRKLVSQTPTVREFTPTVAEPSIRYQAPPRLPIQPVPTAARPQQLEVMRPATELRYLGQVKATYLLCEDREGILLVDQHALAEKRKFEQLKNDVERGDLAIQRLLVPKVVRLPLELRSILDEHQSLLAKSGLEVEAFGDGDVVFKSCPELIEEHRLEAILIESLERLRDRAGSAKEAVELALQPILSTMACHSVVRANQQLSHEQATRLLGSLEKIEQGWTCPHGRPVAFRVSFPQIEKYFERA